MIEVQSVPLESLVEDPKNARTHDRRNIEAIKGSLERFGQVEPLVVRADNGVVVGGNGRLTAMRELGWKHAEVTYQALTDQQAAALGIALNQTAALAGWDTTQLGQILEELVSSGDTEDSLAAIGFDIEALEAIETVTVSEHERRKSVDVEEDEAPEPPKDPITKLGDVWELGRHRLVCGDCRDSSVVADLLAGCVINVAVTSPPYASQRKYDETSGFHPIHPDQYVGWFDAVQDNVQRHLADDGSWFVNIKEHCENGQRSLYVKDLTLAHVRQWGWLFVDEYAWTHGGTPKAVQARFKNGWEPIFHFSRSRHKFRPDNVRHQTKTDPVSWGGRHPSQNDGRGLQKGSNAALQGSSVGGKSIHDAVAASVDGWAYPSNSLSLGKNREALGHGAAYPVSLPSFFINAYSDEGDLVYDPFLGSGTTLIAADQLNRTCFGVEISPAYCDIIVERWQNLTGGKARRTTT